MNAAGAMAFARPFARQEMLEEGETLKRSETIGPFVVALVALSRG